MLELSAHEARLLSLEAIGLRTKFDSVEQVIHPQADDQSNALRDIAYRAAAIGQ